MFKFHQSYFPRKECHLYVSVEVMSGRNIVIVTRCLENTGKGPFQPHNQNKVDQAKTTRTVYPLYLNTNPSFCSLLVQQLVKTVYVQKDC